MEMTSTGHSVSINTKNRRRHSRSKGTVVVIHDSSGGVGGGYVEHPAPDPNYDIRPDKSTHPRGMAKPVGQFQNGVGLASGEWYHGTPRSHEAVNCTMTKQ
jgi:hypothetical protein